MRARSPKTKKSDDGEADDDSEQHQNFLLTDTEGDKNDNPTETDSGPKSSAWTRHKCGDLQVTALIGLCVASVASGLMTEVFELFHVDVFLRAYKLPLHVYSVGSAVFAVINTANDVVGAWVVDSYASSVHRKRYELVGLSGCLFALTFLSPFFRWPRATNPTTMNNVWDGLHFVGSLSLYDTMFSFNCILGSSIVTDNHTMNDTDRILFFAARKIVSMAAPFIVAKVGLSLFHIDNLAPFRVFVVVVAIVAALLCVVAQKLINLYKNNRTSKATAYQRLSSGGDDTAQDKEEFLDEVPNEDADDEDADDKTDNNRTPESLRFWQVVRDFWMHPNFRYWIMMEMLMEGQNTFLGNFEKTFVDRLLYIDQGVGLSRETCNWMLSLMSPMTQIMGLVLYIPIQRYGYARLYNCVFCLNFIFAAILLLWNGVSNVGDGEMHNTMAIMAFMVFRSVMSNSIASTGFGLAMSDMVLEMKLGHALDGRFDAPSLAGMFMGVNALFSKPTESILPILAASLLSGTDYDNANSAASRLVLFRLLVFPPLVCSVLQLFVWSKYSLVPERTQQMREELQTLQNRHTRHQSGNDNEQQPPSSRDCDNQKLCVAMGEVEMAAVQSFLEHNEP